MYPDPSSGELNQAKASASVSASESSEASHPQPFALERAELEWVLAQPEISRAANLVRFLSFICSKYFEGEIRDIREHTIATEALGRKSSNFDSHIDPIVRVTARTLRKKLQTLYSTDGQNRQLQIVLPVGRYVPEFVQRADVSIQTDSPGLAERASEKAEAEDAETSLPGDVVKEEVSRSIPSLVTRLRNTWKITAALAVVVAVFLAGFLFGRHANRFPDPVAKDLNWGEPVWSDEFNGNAQQLPDSAKWTYELEPQWEIGADQRNVYCSPQPGASRECDSHRPNAFQDGMGHLILRAQKNSNGVWTLIRLTTKGLKNFQYGRIEARMKLPVGKGLWPSFVMVGSNIDTVGWPASGSVNIMENVSLTPGVNGLGPTMIRSTLHGPRYFGWNGLWHDFKLPNGARVDDGSFHTYGIIWSPGMMQFYVDDPANIYFVHEASDVPEGGAWAFDHPFYLIMNLSVGGGWAGEPDATTPNPADVFVDYVRAYSIPTVPAPKIEWQPARVKAGSSATSIVSLNAASYAGRVRLSCTTDSPSVPCSLATSVLDFSNTLSQQDTLTLSTNSFTEKGRIEAPPGRYKVTITATTISGDRSQLTMPFEVKRGD